MNEIIGTEKTEDGSTGLVVLVGSQKIYFANCGDSPSWVVFKDGRCKMVTREHKASDVLEQQRLYGIKGCFVRDWNGCDRLFGMLAVTRSFGDFFFHPCLVVDPSITSIERSEAKYVILMSDGISDAVNCKDLKKMIDEDKENDAKVNIQSIGEELLNQALKKESSDNISLIIVEI